MRKIVFFILFLSLSLCSWAKDIVPKPVGWVNDFAGVISQDYKDKLNFLINEIEEKTSVEIVVVTMDTIAPYDEKEYARLLFDNWKPGKKGKDNGVLILLVVKDRLWRIETGYGIEGILPDGLCGEIGRNYMVPYFKNGNYEEGLYYAVREIAKIIADNYGVGIKELGGLKFANMIKIDNHPLNIIFLFFLFIFVFPYWTSLVIVSIILFSIFGFNLWVILFILFLLFLKILLCLRKKDNFERRGFFYNYGGYYGDFGGGFGGGGFSGFGGGFGGGGGAGGRF
jgi:uncharacterized protein